MLADLKIRTGMFWVLLLFSATLLFSTVSAWRAAVGSDAQINELDQTAQQSDRLCELNVVEQAVNVCQTTVVQEAWARGQAVTIHGWIYSLADGRLRDLNTCIAGQDELVPAYTEALARLA